LVPPQEPSEETLPAADEEAAAAVEALVDVLRVDEAATGVLEAATEEELLVPQVPNEYWLPVPQYAVVEPQ